MDQRNKGFARPSSDVAEDPKHQIQLLQTAVEQLARRCRHLEAAVERKKVVIDDLRAHVTRLEELFGKSQNDTAYAQQQLEFVVINLERQRGIVADHTEQLRLFAGESTQRGRNASERQAQRSVLLHMGNWLYAPVVHFAKGVYSLFSPIINTAQSLSLLNSDVLHRSAADRIRWGTTKKGDLLGMLQRGVLDPDASAKRK
ncbi:hypothetical protein ABB37_07861 [Leptomonas pyrrhocoris]|uniref:Uncharacterized protein n=1 Tax=Leptomonas pyrrhocoris TaxID=157538 RepID=A0A0M9FV46_LEPPY|nr:hypothetical protein ABB37_07861 [Leptomonas pyrrhocoris]KPA76577.1 hypothetical protein ABB37_07861 [Leptomonas pyrrhocoris]|eukprot:XP_015655016.1 hypothetical protein ABB37_07861 [Leptomonas pyrrhocoris]